MVRALSALLLAVLAHAVLAAAIAVIMRIFSPAIDLARLDISSVELNLAEDIGEMRDVMDGLRELQDIPQTEEPPSPVSVSAPQVTDAVPDPEPSQPVDTLSPAMLAEPPSDPLAYSPTQSLTSLVESPDPDRVARVEALPTLKRTIRPEYPKAARQRGEEGAVELEMAVDSRGAVSSVSVLKSSGYAELDDAAVRAARKARFVPAMSDGHPIVSLARLTLTFVLHGE